MENGFRKIMEYLVLKYLAVPRVPKAEAGRRKLVCIGDSITYGAGVQGKYDKTWEYFLQEKIGSEYQVLNYGISGRTLQKEGDYPYTEERQYRISQEIQAEKYIIMLGTNDSKPQNRNRERYERELSEFTDRYKMLPNKPQVILMTPPCCYENAETGVVAFNIDKAVIDHEIYEIVRATAARLQTGLIDLHAFTENHPEWFADGVHPNEEGNRAIGAFLYEELKGSLPQS